MSVLKELISYRFLRRCDRIIVLADAAKSYLVKEKNIASEKIEVIRNGIEESVPQSEAKGNSLCCRLKELRDTEKIVVAYMGSFIEWQGVRFIADNFEIILGASNKYVLLMLGNGIEYSYVEKKAEESHSRDRIIMHPGVSKEEMVGIYSNVDIVLIPREKNLSTDTAVPLKAVEAMRREKAILASGDDGIKEVLNDTNSAIYEHGDIEDFVSKLCKLVDDSEYRHEIGKKASVDALLLFTTWIDNSRKMHEIYYRL